MYDENDGFFDHVVPPTPPATASHGRSVVSNVDEIFVGTPSHPSGPYGLGIRVPMLVISPWSKGGWVNSQVFDHTSLIRFVQARFGTASAPLTMPGITAWRQAVCGDLTSAFNFATPNHAVVKLPSTGLLPSAGWAAAPQLQSRSRRSSQALPTQEPGTRPARALPYVPEHGSRGDRSHRAGRPSIHEHRQAGCCFSRAIQQRCNRPAQLYRQSPGRNC